MYLIRYLSPLCPVERYGAPRLIVNKDSISPAEDKIAKTINSSFFFFA